MLAIVNTPNGSAPVEIREVPEPTPAANEALVEVRAFSLNRGELRLMQTRAEGWRPGQDIAGVVVQAAADGTGPKAGARVVALTDNAGWAQRAAVPTHRMAVLADNVAFEAAAALPVAGLTALRTLRHGAPLLGKRVLGHRGGRRRRPYGGADRCTLGRPCHRHRWLARAWPACTRRRPNCRGHRQVGRAIRADPRSGGRGVACRRDRSHRAEGKYRHLRQFVGRADLDQFPRFCRARERSHPELFLLQVRAGRALRLRFGAFGVARRGGSLQLELVVNSWRDLAQIGPRLRDRHIPGKAVFRVEPD